MAIEEPAGAGSSAFDDEPQGFPTHKLITASVASLVAAVLASRVGVAGTLIGAAVTPVIVLTVSFAVEPRLQRGLARGVGRRRGGAGEESARSLDEGARSWSWALSHPRRLWERIKGLGPRRIGLALGAAALSFGLAMIALTGIEAAAGKPVSGMLRDGASGGTTFSPAKDADKKLQAPSDQEPEAQPGEQGAGDQSGQDQKQAAPSAPQQQPQGGTQAPQPQEGQTPEGGGEETPTPAPSP